MRKLMFVFFLTLMAGAAFGQKTFDFIPDSIVGYHPGQNDYQTMEAADGVVWRIIDGVVIYRLDQPETRFFPTGKFEPEDEFLVTKGMDQDGDFVLLGFGEQDGITAFIITYLGEGYDMATFMIFGKVKKPTGSSEPPKRQSPKMPVKQI